MVVARALLFAWEASITSTQVFPCFFLHFSFSFHFEFIRLATVLILECDETGRFIVLTTRDEKSRLWRDNINHAKQSDGLVNWEVFE